MSREVLVTGVGAVTPLGVGARTLHERWRDGACGIEDHAGACRDFDPADFLSVKERRRADRFTQLAIAACGEALADAGWEDEPPFERERIGCILATGVGGLQTVEAQHSLMIEKGPKGVSPLGIPLYMPNAGAASLAMRWGLRGPVYGVVSACAAGANAIGTGLRMIQSGDADAVVVGGAEAALSDFGRACFGAMQALSETGISRPFDARRDGFVMGEGAGVLVLEEGQAARDRGARVLATVEGYASTSDAYHLTAPDPDGGPAARAIELALADAGRTPDELDYINAHGTSTPLNDVAETVAIKRALGEERARAIPVSSTKSAIGHLLGAAGAVEAIATVLALRERVAPPTVGYEVPDPELDLDFVPGTARALGNGDPARPLVAISNSFGFGGHNVVLAFAGAA